MTNVAKQNYSFWELIEQYRIEIPIIQRDYAQGRKGDKSENIRLKFVKDLRKALLPNADKLHLNFVYGKVSNERFVPLDGQQRLTTLFLLHWYLAKVSSDDSSECNERLKQFSYHTRPSSRDFCEALVKSTFSNHKIISSQIKDASWFFDYWKKDPTVEAMLNMLDTIQVVFKDDKVETLKAYWRALKEERQIHFEFLDLEKFDLTDELYVKMNARGKPLTEFENFKAWLMEYVENTDNNIVIIKDKEEDKDWKDKLDTTWADLFWNNKGKGNYTIDQAYMNFFRNMFQIFYVQGKEYDAAKASELAEAVSKSTFISNQFYEGLKILDSKNLNEIFKIIQLVVDHEKEIIEIDKVNSGKETAIDFFNETSLFKSFVSGKVTYADKARFYALYRYLLLKNNTKEFTLLSWMRVCRNLITNSDIDSIEKFVAAMEGIDILASKNNLYQFLIDLKKLKGFTKNQVEEEARKAKLISNSTIEESHFLKFENHSYFRGQVNFLLEMSGEDLGKFRDYGEKCKEIFTYKNKKGGDKEFLLERGLLTIDKVEFNKETGYLMKIPRASNKWSLLKMYNRENKKEILTWRDNFLLNEDMHKLFRLLLDKLSTGDDNELRKFIKANQMLRGWRYQMVEHPIHFQYCQLGVVSFVNNHNIVLYSKRSANTHRRELYSSSFYETYYSLWKNKEFKIFPFTKFKYYSVTNSSATACAYIEEFFTQDKKYHYAIDISYENEEYNIKFFNRNKDENDEYRIETEVYDKLIALDYDFEKKIHLGIPKQITKVKSQDEAVACLNKICDALKTI